MNSDYGKHIINLLKDHECVVLPNLGGFILKPQSAKLRENSIVAPTKIIGFNPSIDAEDGLMIGALMTHYQMSYLTAKSEVEKYANTVAYQLKKNSSHTIEGLGNLFINETKQIKFQSTHIGQLDKQSFGLHTINVQKLPKAVIINKVEEPEAKQIIPIDVNEASEGFNLLKLGFAASAAIFLLCIGLLFTGNSINAVDVDEASIISNFFPKTEALVHNAIEAPTHHDSASFIISESLKAEIRTIEVDEAVAPSVTMPVLEDAYNVKITSQPSGYYLIIGSFTTAQNAEKAVAKVGYEGTYVLQSGNKYRVGVFLSSQKEMASKESAQLKAKYNDGWLVFNN